MPLQFPVGRRTILLCDYAHGGFREPEMVKRRPAVVMTPRLPHRDNLSCVVPLSGTPPVNVVPYVVRIELPEPLPYPFMQSVWWAKCDMVATVGLARLDLFRTNRVGGSRRYIQPKVSQDVFDELVKAMLAGLGLSHLTVTRPGSYWS